MKPLALAFIAFVALYPVITSALWIAGGFLFRLLDESNDGEPPPGGWPGVTVLIPAYNEEAVISTCVQAALSVHYPELEVLVLDDGSTDRTADVAEEARAGDPRCEVVRDPVNRGKADRLNLGFDRAAHELVVVTDADTHLHPEAIKFLVARLTRSPLIVAVAGAPHVTNRRNLLNAMQALEAASIIGLIRRTQAVTGRVGVVAGVLGLFRRHAVLAVGGYEGRMATEDIDLSWRLLLAGGHTAYEPRALVGMEVPSTLRALWAQRKRWARGQGEVLHLQARTVARWRNRRMWPLAIEGVASLAWVVCWVLSIAFAAIVLALGHHLPLFGFGIAWGIAVAVVATIQLTFALDIDERYDTRVRLAFLLAPIYPLAYWALAALAALRTEVGALLTGPRDKRVVWDIPREQTPASGQKGAP